MFNRKKEKEKEIVIDHSEYAQNYSDDDFWEKIKNYALKAGSELIEKCLCLYYVAQKSDVPLWAKTTIYGALAYFISPIDAIPDITPFVGYADDLGVITAAIGALAIYIDDEVKKKAKEKMSQWFG